MDLGILTKIPGRECSNNGLQWEILTGEGLEGTENTELAFSRIFWVEKGDGGGEQGGIQLRESCWRNGSSWGNL